MDPPISGFVARPFVCGVLGEASPGRLERLRQALPGLVTVHEAPDVLLLAATPLRPYRADSDVRAWGFGDRSPDPTLDWQAAAAEAEAPGLADLHDRVVLHPGALGYIDLYTRTLDDATWFASRVEPLLALDPAPLEVDWDAWASVFVLHYPVARATPFLAVRRLAAAEALVFERDNRRTRYQRWSPPWYGLPEPGLDDGDPVAVAEVVRGVMRSLRGGPFALALSGGFDSRLMAITARDAGLPVTVWSTDKDDGLDDRAITTELAAMLGYPLRIADPGDRDYAANGDEVRRRTEGMIPLHTWMGPLGAALRDNGETVITDVGGGILFGNSHLDTEAVEMAPGRDRLVTLFRAVSRPPIAGRTMSEPAAAWAMGVARDGWLKAVAHLDGDASELVLALMETRDSRGIANMPLCLFGPEVQVQLPLLRPEPLRAALSVGLRRKVGGTFYRELLLAADPRIGAVRTTNDPPLQRPRPGRLMTSGDGLAWLRRDIERARSVPDLVPDGLLRYLELGRWAGPRRRDRLLRRSQQPRAEAFGGRGMAGYARLSLPIATFGWWVDRNRDRLASLDPPWRAGRGRRPGRLTPG
jgi:hypothetical protein